MRNLWFRFKGISARLASTVRRRAHESTGDVSARLVAAVESLHEKLAKGVYGENNRPINGDLTKLPLAKGMSATEKQIVHNMRSVSSTLSGTQEIRRQMGRVFQSAPFMYGHGLFITISPNEKHSCLVLRLHRCRREDTLLRRDSPDVQAVRQKLAGKTWPSLFEEADVELPGFDMRLETVSRDPLCAVQGFRVAVVSILSRLLGVVMCDVCGVAGLRPRPRATTGWRGFDGGGALGPRASGAAGRFMERARAWGAAGRGEAGCGREQGTGWTGKPKS